VWLSLRQEDTFACGNLEYLVAAVHFKMAFNNIKDLILVFVPVGRRFVSGLRNILQHAETPARVHVLNKKRYLHPEDIESRLHRRTPLEGNR
jgi:hypothetical protein